VLSYFLKSGPYFKWWNVFFNVWVIVWTFWLFVKLFCNNVIFPRKKVYLIHRRNEFRAENTWIEQAKKRENIEFILNDEVEEIVWDKLWMTWVKLKSWKEVKSDWIFVAVWTSPNTSLVEGLNPQKDEEWCLIVDKRQETSVKWLYAAWDVTTNSNKFKQTIMSAAEWCLAANSVHEDKMR